MRLLPFLAITAFLSCYAPDARAQESAAAQAADQAAADRAMAGALLTAPAAYARRGRPRCGDKGPDGDIVVCAPDDGEQWRVPSTADSDPTSPEGMRDGVPRAPQLDRGSCKGQPNCFGGGWAPPPIYIIDLAAIPDSPKGSDAEKVAKGEMSDR